MSDWSLNEVVKLNQGQLDTLLKEGEVGNHEYSEDNLYLVPAQACKPNLLINPDFRINQRGKSSYTATAGSTTPVPKYYCVDRWRYSVYNGSAASYTPISGGGIHAVANSGDYPIIEQTITNVGQVAGNYVTFTVKFNNLTATYGECVSISIMADNSSIVSRTIYVSEGSSKPFSITGLIPSSTSFFVSVRIRSIGPSSCDIQWTKLEIGRMFTGYYPPEPSEELIKCLQYYQKLAGVSSTTFAGYSGSNGFGINTPICVPFKYSVGLAGDCMTSGLYVTAATPSNLPVGRLSDAGTIIYPTSSEKCITISVVPSTSGSVMNMIFVISDMALDAEDYT